MTISMHTQHDNKMEPGAVHTIHTVHLKNESPWVSRLIEKHLRGAVELAEELSNLRAKMDSLQAQLDHQGREIGNLKLADGGRTKKARSA